MNKYNTYFEMQGRKVDSKVLYFSSEVENWVFNSEGRVYGFGILKISNIFG